MVNTGMCGPGFVPPYFKYGTLEMTFGCYFNFLYSLVVILCEPNNLIGMVIHAGLTSMLSSATFSEKLEDLKEEQNTNARLPTISECFGGSVQALLLLRSLWLVCESMAPQGPDGEGCLLLFSTCMLYNSIIVSFVALSAPLIVLFVELEIDKQDWYK